MTPIPCTLIGYRILNEAIERYRAEHSLPEINDRPLLQQLESTLGIPLALVRVELNDDTSSQEHYLCCFADYNRPYDVQALAALPVPRAFERLPQVIPVEGDVRRLFAPHAMVVSWDEAGKSRVNERGLPIGATAPE